MQTDFDWRSSGAASKPSCSKRVSGLCRKSSHGVRTLTGSYNMCRCGEPLDGDSQGRADDQARVPRRNAGDVNSSTMRGPQGLSGKSLGRRCRSVPRDAIFVPGVDEKPWPRGKGGFLCSTL